MTKFIIVDIEAAEGPTPAMGVMTQFAAIDLESGESFTRTIYATVPDPDTPAIPIVTDRVPLIMPNKAMAEFADWLNAFNDNTVFVSDNPAFDFMWIATAFDRAGIKNPFGHSARRIGDLYAGLSGNWRNTNKWKRYRKTKHDHTALNDVIGNREALLKILEKYEQNL